ncbi:MAG: hypothetical protein PHH84_09450 [Oscillospiraceae bacterium]|nr:hypothetical protein [Oscillospiraceae bacterium]MDD4474235.1 hypothetical protein [Eubacteriales bacterium]
MNWKEGLKRIASIAEKANIEWWTTGSILLPLNGIEDDIKDVDFYFYEKDLETVRNAFQDYIIEPIVCAGSRSETFKYNGLAYVECEVCLFSGLQDANDLPEPTHFGKYAESNLLVYEWNGLKIKAPPIELYVRTLEKWGKLERAQRIKNALKERGK